MASPVIRIDFLVETNIIGQKNSTRSKWVPAVDILSIEESTRFQGMSEVLLTGSVRPDTGVPFIMVCNEPAESLANRINSALGFDHNLLAPPVADEEEDVDENSLAGPAADEEIEAVPV